ncbi:MAG: hypothetical protein AB1921_03795 [Thermodesulfobacteriota bacterium]
MRRTSDDGENEIGSLIGPYRRRLNLAAFLEKALPAASVVLAGYATALILCKMFLPGLTRNTAWVLAFLPAVFIWAYIRARKQGAFFTRYEAAEVLDRVHQNDGSVTAFYEAPDLCRHPILLSSMKNSARSAFPRIRWGSQALRLVPAALYVALALGLPRAVAPEAAAGQEMMTLLTRPLVEKMESLGEVLPPERSEELKQALKELSGSDQGVSRETWEALESLQESMDREAARSADAMARLSDSMDSLSRALEKSGEGASQESGKSLDQALSELSKTARAQGKDLPPELAGEIEKLCKNASPGNAKDKERLKKELSRLAGKMEKLAKEAGVEKTYQYEKKKGMCKGDDCPGRGGISRGRADAPMLYGREKPVPEASYEDQALKNRVLDASDLADLGITAVAPEPDPGKFSQGASRSFSARSGPESTGSRISPVQKEVVSRYFAP